MPLRHSCRQRLLCTLVVATAVLGLSRDSQAQSDPSATTIQAAISGGVTMERSSKWLDAIEHYEEALDQWPENRDLKLGLRRSKVHFSIERRYVDSSFEDDLLNLSQYEALRVFTEVLQRVRGQYVDRMSSTSFVAHGTESLYLAMSNQKFVENNLASTSPERIRQFRTILRDNYWNKRLANQYEAERTVSEICDLARRYTGLRPSAVVFEYICGGCNALDDYSAFLTPDRLEDLYGNIEGEFVGLGIEMKAVDGDGMLLVNVIEDSPAEQGGLKAGEHIIGIDGKDCRNMNTDEAAKLLRGPSGSTVMLQIHSPEGNREWSGRFSRRAVQVKSIPIVRMLDQANGIGYIQMTGFQKSTPAEMDAAIRTLSQQGMQALVWDLRGNPGGLLTAAVKVLDRFIDNGVLVSTKGRTHDQNYTYSATTFSTFNVPIVLLVDEDSASASEIVAGAIRDHRRGTIVGTKTYGKWSVQTILPITGSSGLRLTTAKFYSPKGLNHSKVGVNPDMEVEAELNAHTFFRGRSSFRPEQDVVLRKAMDILQKQVATR